MSQKFYALEGPCSFEKALAAGWGYIRVFEYESDRDSFLWNSNVEIAPSYIVKRALKIAQIFGQTEIKDGDSLFTSKDWEKSIGGIAGMRKYYTH